ncbi:MAG: DUF92 domain-containing protein [Calditrichaeota bacterium]|nr:DUF92 domain-containing protein [Calditrichota bacterium]
MFILSFSLIYLELHYLFPEVESVFLISIFVSTLVTVIETLSSRGSDNLFVPVGGALFLFIGVHAGQSQLNQMLIGQILALLVSVLSYRAKFLSLSGSAMTFLLATAIFGLGGLKWTVPILTFFILSSLLSKTGKSVKRRFKDTFEKSGVRDYSQVLANGGISGILVILNHLFPDPDWYMLYLLSLCVATSDTWSTEIGVLSKSKPRLITTFKKVNPGISGAISVTGTLAGFAGSLAIVFSGMLFISFNLNQLLSLIFLSFLGNLIDSFFGATIQGQYQCSVCRKYTEKKIHCKTPTQLNSGFGFIDNDLVNLSSNLITLLIYALIYFRIS